jgi:hypothetical protein
MRSRARPAEPFAIADPRRRAPDHHVLARIGSAVLLAWIAAAPGPVRAASREFIPVGDPIESELRLLDVLGPGTDGRILLPHLGLRPLQRYEVQGRGPAPDPADPARAVSFARLERALGRDAAPWFGPHPRWRSTPRVFEATAADDQRLELSLAAEGGAVSDTGDARFLSGSGLHARLGVQVEQWLLFTNLLVGRVDRARAFADPILPNTDLIAYTDDTYLAYSDRDGRWSMQFGRGRWHWGPGEEASLLISRTSAPITGLSAQVHLEALHLDASALSATLGQAAGEQLAAHRVEWRPHDALRLGLTETARYRASGWQPLYAIGAIPYILVQRLLVQDEPDSSGALRNNVMLGLDAAWRIAPGTRVYGELLLDDLHARTADNPNKYGWQLGWEGVGMIGSTRLSWGGECTRLSRYVYTSYFGRSYQAQGAPLGFPAGPDSRRISLRAALDLGPDWQLLARVARTDQGENGLDEPFVPGSPRVAVGTFEGVVERTREVAAGLRWWPASGVDLRALAGYRWTDNQAHVTGRNVGHEQLTVEAHLVR